MSTKPRDALTFPPSDATLIAPYLPPSSSSSSTTSPAATAATTTSTTKPHLTLTFATSLDSTLSLSPGAQTPLSGPASKSMTHHLRAHHAAILVGVNTVLADDPSLNCRIEGVGGYGGAHLTSQPQPIIVDPRGRWDVGRSSGWKVLRLAGEGKGRAPWVVVLDGRIVRDEDRVALESVGGKYISVSEVNESSGRMGWDEILKVLGRQGIKSVMVEGGGRVINELLSPTWFGLVDSVVVTIAPTWLGRGGVVVCPEERRDETGEKVPVGRLGDVKWVPLGEDVVLCGRPKIGA